MLLCSVERKRVEQPDSTLEVFLHPWRARYGEMHGAQLLFGQFVVLIGGAKCSKRQQGEQ